MQSCERMNCEAWVEGESEAAGRGGCNLQPITILFESFLKSMLTTRHPVERLSVKMTWFDNSDRLHCLLHTDMSESEFDAEW
jgi:hypothetical protein